MLVAWGVDTYGQLGDGEATQTLRLTPALVLNIGRLPADGRAPVTGADAFCEGMSVALQDGAVYRRGSIYLGPGPDDESVYGPGPVPSVLQHMSGGVTLVASGSFAVKDGVLCR